MIKIGFFDTQILKDCCHILVLRAQVAASGVTKQSLTNIWLFCLILTGIEVNKVFLILCLVFGNCVTIIL